MENGLGFLYKAADRARCRSSVFWVKKNTYLGFQNVFSYFLKCVHQKYLINVRWYMAVGKLLVDRAASQTQAHGILLSGTDETSMLCTQQMWKFRKVVEGEFAMHNLLILEELMVMYLWSLILFLLSALQIDAVNFSWNDWLCSYIQECARETQGFVCFWKLFPHEQLMYLGLSGSRHL